MYSNDVYSQSNGEYGYKFYYEVRDFFDAVNENLAAEWATEIFALKQGEYAGPYALNEQWYFFQVKTMEEIEAEKQREALKKQAEGSSVEETAQKQAAETGFAAVSAVVRSYIEENEISLITDYFRKNLEVLKAKARSIDSLLEVNQEGREVRASFSKTPEFFGFSYSGKEGIFLYDSIDSAFTELGLAAAISKSKQFFEDIFSLKPGELSEVMLLGTEDRQTEVEQQYIVFFRLEESRKSSVYDFTRSTTEALDSRKSLYNYYLNNLLTSGLELEFLNKRNLKQRLKALMRLGILGDSCSNKIFRVLPSASKCFQVLHWSKRQGGDWLERLVFPRVFPCAPATAQSGLCHTAGGLGRH